MQEGEAGGSSSTVADNQAAGEKELSPVTQLLFASTDWATTSLGPVDQWDPNLRVAADLCLGSLFSCCLLVGPDLTFMYNDAYLPSLGDKHPQAMGMPGHLLWAEIWHVLGPMFEEVMREDKPVWHDDLLLTLKRCGASETTYWSFCYSGIHDQAGKVLGIFSPAVETTTRVLNARRMRTLGDLGVRTPYSRSLEEACRFTTTTLTGSEDVLFSVIYLVDPATGIATISSTTFPDDHLPTYLADLPHQVSTKKEGHQEGEDRWPLSQIIRSGQLQLTQYDTSSLSEEERGISHGKVVLLPILNPQQRSVLAVMVIGINSYLRYDDAYRDWFNLIASQLSSALMNAKVQEEERRTAEMLATLDRAKTAFFSNVSHEFRTPLTLMMSPLEIALSDPSTLDKLTLEMMMRNGQRLMKLVNTLLDFSRIEAGRFTANFEPIKIARATQELASCFESAATRLGLKLIVDCPPEVDDPSLPEIYVDQDMWEKIVLNLISNSLKFTWEGSVKVRLRRVPRGGIELNVTDTGVGISEKHLPYIFQRFYRVLNDNARSHEGTGIGLALIKEIVKQHGGTISVASKADVGSTFTVFIPEGYAHLPSTMVASSTDKNTPQKKEKNGSAVTGRSRAMVSDMVLQCTNETLNWLGNSLLDEKPTNDNEDPDAVDNQMNTLDEDDKKMSSPKEPPGITYALGDIMHIGSGGMKPRVILADDNLDMRRYLSFLLDPHFEVEPVPNGRVALRRAREFPPDLVLSDVMMPQMDGMMLLKELRMDPRTVSVPVILLTAKASSSVEGLDAGADDFLVKPFTAKELLARVTSVVKSSLLRRELAAREREDTLRLQLVHSITEKIRSGVFLPHMCDWLVEEFRMLTNADCVRVCRLEIEAVAEGRVCTVVAECLREDAEVPCAQLRRKRVHVSSQQLALFGADREPYTPRPGDVDIEMECDIHVHASADVASVDEKTGPLPELEGTNAVTMAPILVQDTVWGILWCAGELGERKRNGQFHLGSSSWSLRDDSEYALLKQVAGQVGLGVAQARLEAEQRNQRIKLDAANEVSRGKSMIMANTSHELRTPLHAILGLTEVLEDTMLDNDQAELLSIIKHSGDLLLTLVNDILDFSKLEAKQMSLHFTDFDLVELVDSVIEILSGSAGEKDLELSTIIDLPPDFPIVHSDPVRLRQVLLNLINNGIKFTSKGGIILRVSCEAIPTESPDDTDTETYKTSKRRWWDAKEDVLEYSWSSTPPLVPFSTFLGDAEKFLLRVEVADSGIGIDSDSLANLFQPFSQLDATLSKEYEGTGLGLAISKQLVEMAGGEVGVNSELGIGSCFWFTWSVTSPRKHRIANTNGGDTQQASPPCFGVSSLSSGYRNTLPLNLNVLVLEPREDSIISICLHMRSIVAGYKGIPSISQGPDLCGSAVTTERPFDLVMIPVGSQGNSEEDIIRTVQEIRKVAPKVYVLLLALTGRTHRAAARRVSEAIGCRCSHLTKPIRRHALYKCLQAIVKEDSADPIHHRPAVVMRDTGAQGSLDRFIPDDNGSHLVSNVSEGTTKRRVLVVEDNRVNQKVVLMQLSKLNCTVDVAQNGAIALEMIQNQSYNLVLMDLAMPVMDGYQCTKVIRALEGRYYKELPIIALSASLGEKELENCVAVGMSDFLAKPVRGNHLAMMVDKWCKG